MARRLKKTRALVLMGAGAAAAYFGDPELGRTRRVKTKDQVAAAFRRAKGRVEQKQRYVESTLAGKAEAVRSESTPPSDDKTLVDKVKSEVLGKPEFSGLDVVVDAAEGVVALRGEVPDQSVASKLETAVGRVTGVQRVESFVHTPGQPAPNKQAASA
jgi:osmotically-inducible protein OsmY